MRQDEFPGALEATVSCGIRQWNLWVGRGGSPESVGQVQQTFWACSG